MDINNFVRFMVGQWQIASFKILTALEVLHVSVYRVPLHTQGCSPLLLCVSSSLTPWNQPTRRHQNLRLRGQYRHLYRHGRRQHLCQPDHCRLCQVRFIATQLSRSVHSTSYSLIKTCSNDSSNLISHLKINVQVLKNSDECRWTNWLHSKTVTLQNMRFLSSRLAKLIYASLPMK